MNEPRRCPAIRKDGYRCQAFVAAGSDTCASHDPASIANRRRGTRNYPACPTCGRHHEGRQWYSRSVEDPAPPCPHPPPRPLTPAQRAARIARLRAQLARLASS